MIKLAISILGLIKGIAGYLKIRKLISQAEERRSIFAKSEVWYCDASDWVSKAVYKLAKGVEITRKYKTEYGEEVCDLTFEGEDYKEIFDVEEFGFESKSEKDLLYTTEDGTKRNFS